VLVLALTLSRFPAQREGRRSFAGPLPVKFDGRDGAAGEIDLSRGRIERLMYRHFRRRDANNVAMLRR